MVETTLEIRFSGDGEAEVTIDSNVSGETAAQAELIAFAHHTARVISLLGPARAGTLVHALTRLEPGAPLEPAAAGGVGTLHALARFINGASGPRMYFRLKSSGSPDAASSVNLVLDSLRRRRAHEDGDEPLTRTAALLARLGATGQVRRENEFDVALATADVAWRHTSRDWMAGVGVVAHCPACGNEDGDTGFELRLWPSDTAAIRRCRRCGAGLWVRESHAPRLLREDVWSAMESMRHELSAIDRPEVSSVEATRPLLEELKRVFAEHGWPYTEVRGAPVLVTELSGPGGRWSFYAQIVEEKDVILLYSICPERVPEGRRAEVSKFLTRANYGLAAGNFELDFDDGEVRYKTVLQLQGDELDGLTLKRLVRANGVAMETYLPGIRSVVAGAPGDSTT
jgi:Zn ribbon nucleic-acid-binding protein